MASCRKLVYFGGGTLALWTVKEWVDECVAQRQINLPLLLWKSFPARTGTLLWGKISKLNIPLYLREPVFRFYARIYNCNLMELPDGMHLKQFDTLNSFFTRKLSSNSRPISKQDVVSCCDGKVVACGMLHEENGFKIDTSIKGMTLTATDLVGSMPFKKDSRNALFYYVLYLGPGDYHRFHAPFDVSFNSLGHYNGELFPVKTSFLKFFRGVFAVNERIACRGEWKHGFVGYCPIGALGVGSILLNGAKSADAVNGQLQKSFLRKRGWVNNKVQDMQFLKGEEIGRFEMGSTVVVVFEAPPSFSWSMKAGSKIRVGEELGNCREKN